MTGFRFEYYENVITKHNFKKMDWTKPAQWAFTHELLCPNTSIASIRMIDEDTVEIVKRID